MGNKKMRFNIAGAFGKSDQLMMYFFKNKDLIKKFNITVYDGINNCAWNGGRVNRDIEYSDRVLDFYYRNNITIALAFTNPVIDLDDKTGNMLLEKFHKKGNVIISANENLVYYVRKKYPLYHHTRSITSFGKISVPMSDDDFNLYKKWETIYDIIVPRCEHVFDKRFKELDLTKYEVLINDACVYNCPYYGEHFKEVAKQNKKYKKPWKEAGYKAMYEIEECWLSDRSTYKKPSFFEPDEGQPKLKDKLGDNYGMDLKTSQIIQLMKDGINNFKIAGREMPIDDFNIELNTYLIDAYDSYLEQ